MRPLILAFNYRCGSCDNVFEGSGLSDESYGEFIMRSKTGKIVYLNVFQDQFINEIEKLFDSVIKLKDKGQLKEPRIFQAVLSQTVDLAPDGSSYQIGFFPLCPKCGSLEMVSWGEKKPLQLTCEEIKSATHEAWSKFSSEEKRRFVENAVTKYITNHT